MLEGCGVQEVRGGLGEGGATTTAGQRRDCGRGAGGDAGQPLGGEVARGHAEAQARLREAAAIDRTCVRGEGQPQVDRLEKHMKEEQGLN